MLLPLKIFFSSWSISEENMLWQTTIFSLCDIFISVRICVDRHTLPLTLYNVTRRDFDFMNYLVYILGDLPSKILWIHQVNQVVRSKLLDETYCPILKSVNQFHNICNLFILIIWGSFCILAIIQHILIKFMCIKKCFGGC